MIQKIPNTPDRIPSAPGKYPEECAVRSWEIAPGCTGHISPVAFYDDTLHHYCGYIEIPNPGFPPFDDHNDRLDEWVDAHGGVTYANYRENGALVVGFDCAHSGDDRDPRTWDEAWLTAEVERMARSLMRAVPYITRYVVAKKTALAVRTEYFARNKEDSADE